MNLFDHECILEESLWRITAPHFCAGLVVRDGKVVRAAPILAWAVGKEWLVVKRYMVRKGWHGNVTTARRSV